MINSYTAQLSNIKSLLDNLLTALKEDDRVVLAEVRKVRDIGNIIDFIKDDLYRLELKIGNILQENILSPTKKEPKGNE